MEPKGDWEKVSGVWSVPFFEFDFLFLGYFFLYIEGGVIDFRQFLINSMCALIIFSNWSETEYFLKRFKRIQTKMVVD